MLEKLSGLRSRWRTEVLETAAELETSIKAVEIEGREGSAVDVRAVVDGVAAIASKGVVAYLKGFASLLGFGVLLGALSFFVLREFPWYWCGGALLLAFVESGIVAHLLGTKRATIAGIVHGLGTLRLGRAFVGRLFDRMLGATETARVGERGGQLVQAVERLPLGRVEALLNAAVHGVLGDLENKGWLVRKIQARILEAIRKFTLARFRAEEAKYGGVDLRKVQAEIALSIDDALVERVESGGSAATIAAVVGLPLLVAAQTVALWLFLHNPS